MTEQADDPHYEDHPRYDGAAVIIGAGSIGSFVAAKLAKAGFRALYLLDRDVLEQKNVPRHYLGVGEIGQPKAVALAHRLVQEAPDCVVVGDHLDFMDLDEEEQIAYLSQAQDGIVVAATDSTECQLRINQLCVDRAIPAVYPGIGIWPDESVRHGEVGHILPVVPGEGTPCFQCYMGWRPQEDTGDEAVPGRGGAGLDIDYFAGVVAWAVIGLFYPDDPHAEVFDPARPLTLVHNLSSVSPSVQPYFEHGNIANLELSFPRTPCPVCGGQEISPSLPPSPPPQSVPVTVPQPTPSPMDDFMFLAPRGAWFFGTIGVLLILLGIEGALHLWGNILKILFWGGLNLGVIGYGLYRTFRNVNMSEILYGLSQAFRNRDLSEALYGFYRAFRYRDPSDTIEPSVVWTAAAVSTALLILGSIVLADTGGGPPAQAASGGQSGWSDSGSSGSLPETASTAFNVSPSFAAKSATVYGPAGDNAGDSFSVSLTPSLNGFTLNVAVQATYDPSQYTAGTPASTLFGQSCMDITGPTTQDGMAGETYREPPLSTNLTDSGGTITGTLEYAAILPGSYGFDFACLGVNAAQNPIDVGSVTTTNLGISDGNMGNMNVDNYNAMTVFAEEKSATDTVILFGAVGTSQGSLQPSSDSCIIYNPPPQDPTIARPASISVSEQKQGNGQWYELGTLTFNLSASQISNGTPAYDAGFYYNCGGGQSTSGVISKGGGVILH